MADGRPSDRFLRAGSSSVPGSSEAGRHGRDTEPHSSSRQRTAGLHCQLLQLSRIHRSSPCVQHHHLFPDHTPGGAEPPALERACELGQAPGPERSSQRLRTRDGGCQAHVFHGALGLWLEQVWWRTQGLFHPAQERREARDSAGCATTEGQSCIFCLARPCSSSLPWGSWSVEITTVLPRSMPVGSPVGAVWMHLQPQWENPTCNQEHTHE